MKKLKITQLESKQLNPRGLQLVQGGIIIAAPVVCCCSFDGLPTAGLNETTPLPPGGGGSGGNHRCIVPCMFVEDGPDFPTSAIMPLM